MSKYDMNHRETTMIAVALVDQSNAEGNDLVKRNLAIELLVGPKVDGDGGKQTDRLLKLAMMIAYQGK